MAFEEQRRDRIKKISSNSKDLELKRKQALCLKHELDEGLSKWAVQVMDVQENNIKRAGKQVEEERSRRRERLREERRSRERQDKELELKRQKIKNKNKREDIAQQRKQENR